jgi:thiamine-monophosphate kinase
LLRHGAQVGDDVYVSGTLGDARLALEVFRGNAQVEGAVFERARARMECPTPRVELGQALRGVAHAAIDVSDGLLGDLGHVLKRSGVGAQIDTGWVQGSAAVTPDVLALPWPRRLDCVLAGGDDYELLFTAAVQDRERVHALASDVDVPVTRIGRITAESGLRVLDPQGQPINRRFASFDHFSA